MNRLQAIPPALFAIIAAIWLAGLFAVRYPFGGRKDPAPAADAQPAEPPVPSPAEVAFGPVTLRVHSAGGDPIPAETLAMARIALRAALEAIPADAPATLDLHLQPPPRNASPFGTDRALAVQRGDEIFVRVPAGEPLLLANRIAHETSHWLLRRACGGRLPPLWLDEGHAVLVGRAAAETAARTLRQKLLPEPALPPGPRYPLGELAALSDYPADPDRAALFYAQSRLLVENLLAAHGRPALLEMARDLSLPGAPTLPDLLRTRYYSTPADLARLLPGT